MIRDMLFVYFGAVGVLVFLYAIATILDWFLYKKKKEK